MITSVSLHSFYLSNTNKQFLSSKSMTFSLAGYIVEEALQRLLFYLCVPVSINFENIRIR